MKLIYTANARIPSEKAHPYQIVQMCEALSSAGAEVTLMIASRRNKPHLQGVDIWSYYRVEQNFSIEQIPCIDLYVVAESLPGKLARLWDRFASLLVQVTYQAMLLVRLLREKDTVIFSRNPITLALLMWLFPRRGRRLFFEAHTFPVTSSGLQLRRWLAPRLGGIIAITGHLAERHKAVGARRILTAHDGYREARFAITGDKHHWREVYGWPDNAFIIGYMGRFEGGLERMDKGIGTLVEAAILLAADSHPRPVRLALVGGPEPVVERIRQRITEAGLDSDFLLYPGMVPAYDVPSYLKMFDVCTIPSPWNEFFAYFTSPLKLFEYMASGNPLIASDLPSTAEVLHDDGNALLVPPSDVQSLVDALRRLRDDPVLGQRLAAKALEDVRAYTWEARARAILRFIEEGA